MHNNHSSISWTATVLLCLALTLPFALYADWQATAGFKTFTRYLQDELTWIVFIKPTSPAQW